MRLSRTPHFIVASAMCSCMRVLMVLRSERDWSRVISPKTARSAVRDNWSTASWKSLISKRADFTSITWQKIVAETRNATLSLVMTDCWSPVIGNSRMSTFSMRSAKGKRMDMPGWRIDRNSPKRFTTPT